MTNGPLEQFKENLLKHGVGISANDYDRLRLQPNRRKLERDYLMPWAKLKEMVLLGNITAPVVADYEPPVIPDYLAKMAGHIKKIPAQYSRFIADIVVQTEIALERQPVVYIDTSSTKEAAVICVSDLHAGKLVFDECGNPIYNKEICAYRLSLLAEKVIHLIKHHIKDGTIDEVYILVLGDVVDGSGIYPSQEINQDLTCFVDQIGLASSGIWNLTCRIRAEVGVPVHIECVPGNHGRQGKLAPVNNNFDYLVYQQLWMLAHYEDDGVSVDYSTSSTFKNIEVKGHKVHLRHMAPAQTETAAARAKFGGWQNIHQWEVLCYAHLHHPGNGSWAQYQTFMNGSPIGIDDLSESMAVQSRPSQVFFGMNSEMGVSFKYDIYLDELPQTMVA